MGSFCESPQAERTQRSGGMVKCASVLVILCFIMLVLLILKEIIFWTKKQGWTLIFSFFYDGNPTFLHQLVWRKNSIVLSFLFHCFATDFSDTLVSYRTVISKHVSWGTHRTVITSLLYWVFVSFWMLPNFIVAYLHVKKILTIMSKNLWRKRQHIGTVRITVCLRI